MVVTIITVLDTDTSEICLLKQTITGVKKRTRSIKKLGDLVREKLICLFFISVEKTPTSFRR